MSIHGPHPLCWEFSLRLLLLNVVIRFIPAWRKTPCSGGTPSVAQLFTIKETMAAVSLEAPGLRTLI
jgi:hypothetical protein